MQLLEEFYIEDFEEIWNIMEYSFPVAERRSYDGQRNSFHNPCYRVFGHRIQGKIAAFLAVWKLDGFWYVEHFAVKEEFRGSGIGANILTELLKTLQQRVVLEVEPPSAGIAERRIAFYRRNGFVLNEYDYIQPELTAGAGEIPLRVMSYPDALNETEFAAVKKELYKKVYGKNS